MQTQTVFSLLQTNSEVSRVCHMKTAVSENVMFFMQYFFLTGVIAAQNRVIYKEFVLESCVSRICHDFFERIYIF